VFAAGEMFSPSLSDVDLMVSHEGELDEQLRATGEQMAAAIRARLPNTALTDTAGILRAASLVCCSIIVFFSSLSFKTQTFFD
jgi:hypothetical protein